MKNYIYIYIYKIYIYILLQTLVRCKWGTRSRLQRYWGLVELYKIMFHLWRLYMPF